jgi:hypothetical protein
MKESGTEHVLAYEAASLGDTKIDALDLQQGYQGRINENNLQESKRFDQVRDLFHFNTWKGQHNGRGVSTSDPY